jgi:hypothetical protein
LATAVGRQVAPSALKNVTGPGKGVPGNASEIVTFCESDGPSFCRGKGQPFGQFGMGDFQLRFQVAFLSGELLLGGAGDQKEQ